MAQGCEPLAVHHIIQGIGGAGYATEGADAAPFRAVIRKAVGADDGWEPSAEEIAAALSHVGAKRSSDHFESHELDDAVVISAEEVADYFATFPVGSNMLDLLDCLAPPFDRLFVEFQHRPYALLDLESWGLLIAGVRHTYEEGDEGWVLGASLIGEWQKGHPVGPIVRWLIPLDERGFPDPGDRLGLGSIFAFPLEIPGMAQGTPTTSLVG
jgi:hypothetical protein